MRSASCQEGSSWRIKMFANEAHSQIVAALSGRSEATASLLNVFLLFIARLIGCSGRAVKGTSTATYLFLDSFVRFSL